MINKFLLIGGGLVAAGGTSAGIYYGVSSQTQTGSQEREKNLGSQSQTRGDVGGFSGLSGEKAGGLPGPSGEQAIGSSGSEEDAAAK